MSIKQNPDYRDEVSILHTTMQYIETVINTGENNESVLRTNIRDAYLRINSLDASEGYIALLTNVKFLEMTKHNLRQLQQISTKPYFCRIDIKPEGFDLIHNLYIGKASLFNPETQEPVIVDWRSPIANVYYEGRIGDVTYETQTGTAHGELFRKRQYTIEQGELQDYRDIDLTTRDELLQESLGGSADNRLKDIVSTIQEEQNKVIRAEMYRPMVVQGVAGSGKTTIALHRIAYLIYTHGERFDPDQFMILAPHQLFLKYIANVLPELGVEAVRQTTFIDFLHECLGKKVKLINPNEKLFRLLESKTNGRERGLIKAISLFKGSLEFKELIDIYLSELLDRMMPNRDFKLGKHVLAPLDEIHKFFYKDYVRLPIYKRVEKIKSILQDRLKTAKKDLIKQINVDHDDKIEEALFAFSNPEKRREKVVMWMDSREKSLKEVEEVSKSLVKEYMSQFPKQQLLYHYQEIVSNELLLSIGLGEEQISYFISHSLSILDKKQIELEDSAALLYLQHKLFGLQTNKVRNLVIDEAQDYSIFQLLALKEVLGTEMFTILGDLSQGIHSYRGIQSWQDVLKIVFPNGNCNYLVLEQSYRTTVEIMETANRVIAHSNTSGLVLAKPVVRHGDVPKIIEFVREEEVISELITSIETIKGKGFNSIAIIGKTKDDCLLIKTLIEKKKTKFTCHVLDEKESYDETDIVIVPSYVVKGLEFDAVFIVCLKDTYTHEDLDVKLLYVAMTRPLHHLSVYSMKDKIALMDTLMKDE